MYVFSLISLFLAFSVYSKDLNFYLKLAEKQSNYLKKYKYDYLTTQETIEQVSALPDPTLGVGLANSPVETRLGPQSKKISLSQKIPWFGTLKTKKNITSEETKFKLSLFENAKNLLFFQIKSKWYEIYENKNLISLVRENTNILKSYEVLVLSRYENTKNVSLVDVLKIQIELEKLKTDLEFYQDREKTLLNDFNLLIGNEIGKKINTPEKLKLATFSVLDQEMKKMLLKKTPLYLSMKFRLEKEKHKKKLANLAYYPNLKIGLDYIVIDKPNIIPPMDIPSYIAKRDLLENGGKDAVISMFNINIPINWKKNRARNKQALYEYKKIEEETKSILNNLESKYENVYLNYSNAFRKVKLYEKEIELSNKALEILLSEYTNSNRRFEEVLEMQQVILKYQTLYENAYKKQNASVANLIYIIGGEKNENQFEE